MQGQEGIRRVGGLTVLAAVTLAALAPSAHGEARAVDRTYRGSQATIVLEGDELTLDARAAAGPVSYRLRTPAPVRVTAACGPDVVGLDLSAPFDGDRAQYEAIVDPDVRTATARIPLPGLAARITAGVDGCRATVSEPAGYRVADVAVGFTPAVQERLYRQSLRTTERNRQALAAAEAVVTSALTHYVTHRDDLRGWGPTPDGRVPGEAVLRLRFAPDLRAVSQRPAYDDVAYLLVPPGRPPSRDRLTIVVPSTAIDGRLLVLGRDLRTGRVRYQLVER
ncbi:MAG: hypothetical protein JWM31_1252, partial [Solirubrobacterales bacterium]|nr:hypothetical protein [Solirubrobacterales bacterium]